MVGLIDSLMGTLMDGLIYINKTDLDSPKGTKTTNSNHRDLSYLSHTIGLSDILYYNLGE
jgi:hypothetical protein